MKVLLAASARARLHAARALVEAGGTEREWTIVGASRDAADAFVRTLASSRPATFGLHRATLPLLVHQLAWPRLVARNLARATPLTAEAVATRAIHGLVREGRLPYFQPIAPFPGFPRALAATLAELRLLRIPPAELEALPDQGPDLAALLEAFTSGLTEGAAADAALVYEAAIEAIAAGALRSRPALLLDVPLEPGLPAELFRAVAAAVPELVVTLPAGDERSRAVLEAQGAPIEELPEPRTAGALPRLRRLLFAPPRATSDDDAGPESTEDLLLFSAPGEARECVEVARQIQAAAAAGTPFDRIAVLLRSPESHAASLETALRRAGIPAYFVRGTKKPDASGRAFLALLECADERLSAARFAEYLSLGQVPVPDAAGAPPAAPPAWRPPDDAMPRQLSLFEEPEAPATRRTLAGAGTLPAPHRWEELLVDAAVIGSLDRWKARLAGYERELSLKLSERKDRDGGSAAEARAERDLANLAHLERFAIPVVSSLAALPEGGSWRAWLDALEALAPRVLRRPEGVAAVLAELRVLDAVGPVGVAEVRQVLGERLRNLVEDPPHHPHGRVFVAPAAMARGLSFDLVLVPGLAERLFPRKPAEDPLLPDELRARLSSSLPVSDDRLVEERLLLRLAVGAAERRLVLSFPRLDVGQARARSSSFYLLDVLRAVRGRIHDVSRFERDLALAADAALAWPAPSDPAGAIDAMEHDLASIRPLLSRHAPDVKGRARYLLDLNPHLARSLRSRYRRWSAPFGPCDGLVVPQDASVRSLLDAYLPSRRAYSVTSLERYAACPYQFVLHAIHRLEPREEPVALDKMDPLTLGRFIHQVHAEALRALEREQLLPIPDARLSDALAILDAVLDREAAHLRDELAPPIPRVYQDEVERVRTDLRVWLASVAADRSWVPHRFEMGFGLPVRAGMDPRSRAEAVRILDRYLLHGMIDLVERAATGEGLRITDYKTGRATVPVRFVVNGGATLQPVLYALAAEEALGRPVLEGRLDYGTTRGGFTTRVVSIGPASKHHARQVLDLVEAAVQEGFLPAAPRPEKGRDSPAACRRCDFVAACGPYEERRLAVKDQTRLKKLAGLRWTS